VVDHLQFGPHTTELYLLLALFGPLLGTAIGVIGGSAVADRRSRVRPEGLPAHAPG
jgi:hypothetical protein